MNTSAINLLTLIGTDTRLKREASTGGGEYHGACPFCGGHDRFSVQPNRAGGGRWSCRVCTPHWSDAIAYLQKRNGIDFKEACERLQLEIERAPQRRSTPAPARPLVSPEGEYAALHNPAWQAAARAFTVDCMNRMDTSEADRARAYLIDRGLTEDVITAAELGYNPADQTMNWGGVDVKLPRGIVIPWEIDRAIWRVNIRVPAGERRYIQAAGCANGLYRADHLRPGCTAVLVEGEIDALSILAAGVPGVVPVATGTTSWARLMRWVAKLATAERVLLAFDDDENQAGEKAADWWGFVLGRKAQRLKPTRHDVNDMLRAGDDLAAWIGGVR